MADTMKVFCPHCLNEFDVDVDAGEEVLNPTATITRHSSMRASWSDIAAEIRSGHGYRVLGQDDIVTFTLKNGEQAAVQVVAVDHYERNSMLFAFVDCPTESVMNDRNTNTGGWHDSKMRKKLNEDFIKLLPDDLVEVIKPRTITQILGGRRYESTDKLWLPSLTEVFGEQERYRDCDFGDKQFPAFNTPKKLVKMLNKDTWYWWMRSPYVGNSTYFWVVNYYGVCDDGSAINSYGVCPCFSI